MLQDTFNYLIKIDMELTISDKIQIIMIATTLLVAFLGPYIAEILKHNFHKPKLKIFFQLQNPFCHKTKAYSANGSMYEVYYFRMRIHNEGKLSAEDCKVFLESIATKDSSGDYIKEENYSPITLSWSARAANESNELTIHPDNSFFIDVGFINEPKQNPKSVYIGYSDEEQKMNKFVFSSNFRQFSQFDSLIPGDYILQISVYSKNAERKTVRFSLSWSGDWSDTENQMFQNIVIKEISKKF